MNQLQKDLKEVLWLIDECVGGDDRDFCEEAIKRLEWYANKDLGGYETYTGDDKPFLKIHNDYFIQVGDDGILFSLHKPSDIRSLCHIINRMNGFSELQCEYNDLEMM